MRDFPSCFGENGVQIADSSSSSSNSNHHHNHYSHIGGRNGQNLVSSMYRAHLRGRHQRFLISVTWSRNLMGQGFSISIDDDAEGIVNKSSSSSSSSSSSLSCKVEIKPWLFSKKKGSRTLDLGDGKLDILWDLSSARFASSGGPEPLESFFVALVFDHEMVLLLGDLVKEACRKANAVASNPPPVLVAKREHIFGKRSYSTKAQLCDDGHFHDIVIECETAAPVGGSKEPYLEIRIDRKRVMQIKRLSWKFRGNQTILVDGLPVEVFWDVHNWLFSSPVANAVFMFQTSTSDKLLLPAGHLSSSSDSARRVPEPSGGFSLVLYAWKNE